MESMKTQEEALASTGRVMEVREPTLQAAERYPKTFINPEKKTMGRNYQFSEHDNRATLQDNIDIYNAYGLGRKKCVGDRRQHNSHFCLSHDDSMGSVDQGTRVHTVYQGDFLPSKRAESCVSTSTRRFPRSHLQRSHQAAAAQAGERFMWFGRHDLDHHIPLNVLAAANHSS
ncbi:testis-expressed protein 36 isoform X2 [Brachyhypopomus gauderio]|uniref:testis-expressed protein 36 isoform X2 n=1 Tax=Brachyhypopomus gauderio TaxID=698409 RepID=UPI00404180F5